MARSAPLASLTVPASSTEQTVARAFADALGAGDIDAVVALLTDDAWLAMPPGGIDRADDPLNESCRAADTAPNVDTVGGDVMVTVGPSSVSVRAETSIRRQPGVYRD